MSDRALDWFRQGERDLTVAEEMAANGRHEWACFAAHQGAEKAVKALNLFFRQDVWGHAISKLMAELPDTIPIPGELLERARYLDTFYIPPRDPNSHPEGPPFEYFGPLHSQAAIDHARSIVEFVRSQMARS